MHPFFDGTRPGRIITTSNGQFELPTLYYRDDSFQAMFTADLDALYRVMPSDQLHPIKVGRNRALFAIAAFNYLECSVAPYGEVGIVVPVVHGRKPPPLLPALFESSWPGTGVLVLHLPVTTKLARDGGRDLWGYTKFLAEMHFDNTPEFEECRLDEGGEHILTLRVVKRGIAIPDQRPLVTYSVKDRALIRTKVPQRSISRTALGAGGSFLELGKNHPVARSIRELGVDLRPIATRSFFGRSAILPEGEIIERNVRPLEGYLDADTLRVTDGSTSRADISSRN